MNKLSYWLEIAWLFVLRPFRTKHTANVCKHKTLQKGQITSMGETFMLTMPLSINGRPDYCLDCVGKMSIQCAWCGNAIHVGDPVTLYIPRREDTIPEHAVKYSENSKSYVGCLGWNCASSGADRQGFWVPPGTVERVASPMEMLLAAGGTAQGVIVSDLQDQTSTGKVF